MAGDRRHDPELEWLDHVQPIGLVVAPVLLRELGLASARQTQVDSAAVAERIGTDAATPMLQEIWPFFETVLGWEPQHVAGSPGGPDLPDGLHVRLPEHDTTLSPTWAVRELDGGDRQWQLLVRIEPTGVDPDARGSGDGWEATPHQRFERLLRETGVFAGLLLFERRESREREDRCSPELRLVYAPRGETSGHVTFPLRELGTVAGRPMLGGLKLLLDSFRLFADASDRRLPALLKKSREAQAAVSTALAEQVLGALHELLRGLDAAKPELIRELARTRPAHLYEGLLTVLMRLVFILYAEDRDLLPSRTDGRTRLIYETSYSMRGLYARLSEDAALHPDTMDERSGGWGRLLALFRLVHKGHTSRFVQARGGKLFDPNEFPFLEGRFDTADPPGVLTVSDGCVLRILEGLMTLKSPAGRERLSYRTLDVEQIGSVYETVMGFTVETTGGRSLAIKAGKNNRTPVYVDLEKLVATKGKDRIKFLKEEADRGQLPASVAKAVEAAQTVADMTAALDGIADERGSPRKHESAAGTPILQPTDERRRTGSHYTPRSLTEPIVRHALEPTFKRLGPDATPEQILDLKVCDPAMGSGAFLVEACRALAARLVEAWARHPGKRPVIPADEDEDLHARRLVAQRCLYGVDKNPLATDLAKLSLWLATLARDHEFTFLDHALKSGDSLVGLTQAQIAAAHWDMSRSGLPLFRQLVKDRAAEAMKGRAEIQAASDDTARAIQEARHRTLEARLREIRLIADAVIAAFFAAEKPRGREVERAKVESWLGGSPVAWDKLAAMAATLKQGARPLMPFHWEIEFPEVFARQNGGFDAIVGNPPFLGGTWISGSLGPQYFEWLKFRNPSAGGRADLVAYFFRAAFSYVRDAGAFGLIATNTIRQGDKREAGLAPIIRAGGQIINAVVRLPWPGDAAVIVSTVHVQKGTGPAMSIHLNAREVERVNSFLLPAPEIEKPDRLSSNEGIAFKGFDLYGMGFTFDDSRTDGAASSIAQMNEIAHRFPSETVRIRPYLGGEEINSSPTHSHHRYAIMLTDLTLADCEARYPNLLKILREKVLPERLKLPNTKRMKRLKEQYWRYNEDRPGLVRRLQTQDWVLACSQVSPHFAIARLPSGILFANYCIVFTIEGFNHFAAMQGRCHEIWTRFLASSMKDDLRYTPSDCFETFPFAPFEASPELETAGRACHDHRAALMVARNEGMTKTYNRFHDRSETAEDIQRLRELHASMDRAVLEAYGWHDLAARAEPVFLDETDEDDYTYQGRLFWPSDFRDEVLARLLALNAERHAEEVRLGVAPGVKTKAADDEEAELEDG
jgi:hypothetical protein